MTLEVGMKTEMDRAQGKVLASQAELQAVRARMLREAAKIAEVLGEDDVSKRWFKEADESHHRSANLLAEAKTLGFYPAPVVESPVLETQAS